MQEDVELHLMVQRYHSGLKLIEIQISQKTRVVFISVVQR